MGEGLTVQDNYEQSFSSVKKNPDLPELREFVPRHARQVFIHPRRLLSACPPFNRGIFFALESLLLLLYVVFVPLEKASSAE